MTKPDWPTSEAELAAAFRKWKGLEGFTHHPEVEIVRGEAIVDLVLVKGRFAAGFEFKTTLSADVIRQAFFWTQHADKVSIVVPAPRGKRNIEKRMKIMPVLQQLGLGLIQMPDAETVEVVLEAMRQPAGRSAKLIEMCRPEHDELGTPGSPGGGQRFTRFSLTVRNLQFYVHANPGCTIKEAVRHIEHHWQSKSLAIQRLQAMAHEGKLDGIQTMESVGQLALDLTAERRAEIDELKREAS